MGRLFSMKLTEKDLIGQIEGFPVEVVEKMVERQVEQGNPADVEVFQMFRYTTRENNGFDWDDSCEGSNFWGSVIADRNFDLFFTYYPTKEENGNTTIEKIKQWVIERNLHTGDARVQMCKTMEELGELASGINKGNKELQKDSIGDVVVTLICISLQLGLDFDECLEIAYNEIKDRKGETVNGVFIKESDL